MRFRCRIGLHRWRLRAKGLTVSMFDIGAKGELYECLDCPELKAK